MKIDCSYSALGEFHIDFSEEVYGIKTSIGPKFISHGHPRQITGDRLAVGIVLLKGARIGNSLDVGRKVSSRVADSINKFFGGETISISNVVDNPPANINGGLEIVLSDSQSKLHDIEDKLGRKRMLFVDLPTDRNAGRLFTFDSIQIASNSFMFGSIRNGKTGLDALLSRLFLPIIYATDLGVSRISLEPELVKGLNLEDFKKVAKLLQSIEINLVVGGELVV